MGSGLARCGLLYSVVFKESGLSQGVGLTQGGSLSRGVLMNIPYRIYAWYSICGIKIMKKKPFPWKIQLPSHSVWTTLGFHSTFGLKKCLYKSHLMGYTSHLSWAWFLTILYYVSSHFFSHKFTALIYEQGMYWFALSLIVSSSTLIYGGSS